MNDEFRNVLCWNADTRARVTNTIALDVDPAVFRATHSPSALRRAGAGAGAFVSETEDVFLADFVSPAHPHVLAAAVGESGAGKSHFIRWLHVELTRLGATDGSRRHVVLVPRSSANLHSVIEQILHGFTGPVVQQVRNELTRARGRLTEKGARHRVLDELAFVLGDENRPPRPGAPVPTDDERELRVLLSDFLRDGAVRDWLLGTNTVIARLGDHIAGTRTTAPEEGALLWHPDQLEVPPTVQQKTGGNAREAANLLMTDPEYRRLTAAMLNAAWADASAALLGLRRGNLGGALVEIRKELFVGGQELVLLLEDLSVTQGLDDELMEALIVRPNERPGESLCVLRSVIGLTPDDFAALRDNIRGRLHRWVDLSPPLSEDGPTGAGRVNSDDFARFAARYLNAARYSRAELERWHSEPRAATEPLPSYCVESECPHRSTCHDAFGSVTVGEQVLGLYPFTAEALVRLDENARTERLGAAPTFNPRRIVGRVLNTVLASAERDFLIGTYPTSHLAEEFRLSAVTARTQVELESRYGSEAGRYRWALEVYSPQAPVLSRPIASAFGLPVESETVTSVTKPIHPKPDAQRPEPTADSANALDAFDLWANGGRVEDKHLNLWRGYVYDAVCGRIDWDTEQGFAAVADAFRRTYIHFKGQFPGSDAGDVKLNIAQEARSAVALRDLARFQSGKLSDVDAEAALAQCLPWVDRLATQVREQLRDRVARLRAGVPDSRATGAVLLALGAVFRGDAKFSDPLPQLLARALEPWPQGDPPEVRDTHWRLLWREFQKREADTIGRDKKLTREGTIRAWLKKALGCPKGTSTEAGVLDPSPVLAALAAFQKSGALPPLPPEATDWPAELAALRGLNEKATEYLPKALDEDRAASAKWLTRVEACFEAADQKQQLADLVVAIERAENVGVLAGRGALELADRAKTLSRKLTKTLTEGARKAAEATGPRDWLVGCAARNAEVMAEVLKFIDDAETVLDASAQKAQLMIERFTGEGGAGGLTIVRAEAAQLSQSIPALLADIIGEADRAE